MYGKKRYIPNLQAKNRVALDLACRLAINTIIQGSATEVMKIAMITIQEKFVANQLQAQILLNIHDQLIISAPTTKLALVEKIVKESMISAAVKDLTLMVTVLTGHTWHDVTKE